MNLRSELERRLTAALRRAAGGGDWPAMVAPASRAQFGDYQANGVMTAAKALKTSPHALAEKTAAAADLGEIAQPLEVAGPGFINVRLRPEWVAARLAAIAEDPRIGAEPPARPQTVVVDYSSPNLAKEMHVGHLRSTIIGDALARTLDFLGHNVIRQNHVGDWGTQFGMLVAYLDLLGQQRGQGSGGFGFVAHINDLEEYYRQAKQLFDENPEFARVSREYVVRLQSGDAQVLQGWSRFKTLSWQHCAEVYEKLDVSLDDANVRGESAYNEDLGGIVADLDKAGLLTESEGARCVFLPAFRGRGPEGGDLPVIVQKSDGGYLYATTDLAAMRYRGRDLKADRILYVTDSRQAMHFEQVFAVARAAGFVGAGVSLEHVPFGMMLGADGRPFRTREGGTVKLMDLLDEAERRAFDLVTAKNPALPLDSRRRVAQVVGTGAVKYADLSQNRTSDYVFSYDKMLSLEGNTAPYMQYAHARIRGIFRKRGQEPFPGGGTARETEAAGKEGPRTPFHLAEPAERALGVRLLQFPETVQTVAEECLPNVLCAYLYDLAAAFTGFYESCPVLKSEEPVRASRLALCDLTARTMRTGLGLLGIRTVDDEQM